MTKSSLFLLISKSSLFLPLFLCLLLSSHFMSLPTLSLCVSPPIRLLLSFCVYWKLICEWREGSDTVKYPLFVSCLLWWNLDALEKINCYQNCLIFLAVSLSAMTSNNFFHLLELLPVWEKSKIFKHIDASFRVWCYCGGGGNQILKNSCWFLWSG